MFLTSLLQSKRKKKEDAFILWFEELDIEDIPLVGGKNAALGEMYAQLVPLGMNVPGGFAVTAAAYWHFLKEANLEQKIRDILEGLNVHSIADLQRRGKTVRQAILRAELPLDLKEAIRKAYRDMGSPDVAVRSSATAEDLPTASFAGQQETYLNVKGEKELLLSIKKAFASLFTDRAISYREDKGFSHLDVALSVGVQQMVRADKASSGVLFTLDTETGFDKVVVINSSFGLGETIVQGKVTPDEFVVFKPSLEKGYKAILEKTLGKKTQKVVYGKTGAKTVAIPKKDQESFSLKDREILQLATWGVQIEEHFSKKRKKYQPMDIEWAKDGITGKLFVVQARPETIHAIKEKNAYQEYRLKGKGKVLVTGAAVGTKIVQGKVRVIKQVKNIQEFQKGEILVTESTDPDWEPIMKIATSIITDKGGRTSHAAIISRELGISSLVGTGNATEVLKTGNMVTLDCSSGKTGYLYQGKVAFEVKEHKLDTIPKTRTKVMVNIGSPEEAFANAFLPAQGVGLGRIEFIIASDIGIHPNALLEYQILKKKDARVAKEIEKRTQGYQNKAEFFVDKLVSGIAKIAAAFWPHQVIIRFSDFKTNEYETLLGGKLYEPREENPMLGWRGASRFYSPGFKHAFGLECKALTRVREEMGLKNVIPMVPFCRTPEEGKKVLGIMEEHGLSRLRDKELKVYVMCEIPSNVLLANEFLELFDGMSIGSNDLTQLVLGLDRDSAMLAPIGNENNEAVKKQISQVIQACKRKKKYSGICGQAPSDYPEFTKFLVREGIESISLNPDVFFPTLEIIAKTEK